MEPPGDPFGADDGGPAWHEDLPVGFEMDAPALGLDPNGFPGLPGITEDFDDLSLGPGGTHRPPLTSANIDVHVGIALSDAAGPSGASQGAVGGFGASMTADAEDPLAALEAAIEEDKPRHEPSAEWQRMLAAVDQADAADEAVMLPDHPAAPAEGSDTEGRQAVEHEASPAHVLMAVQSGSATTSGGSGPAAQSSDSADDDAGQAEGQAGEPSGAAAAATAASEADAAQLEAKRRATFASLQPVCSKLLLHRSDAAELAALLRQLAALLEAEDPVGLQGCFDYAMFPLQLALEGIASARQPQQPAPPPANQSAASALPAMAADVAAEAALRCLALLLSRCRWDRGEQLLGTLQRLSAVLAVEPESASEEIRLLALRCVAAALAAAQLSHEAEVLRQEESAPVVGHLSSLLLQCADAELRAGSAGSKAVRAEAMRALRAMLDAVDSAEALSFFLPGLTSGLGRALLVASGGGRGARALSGAASSGAAASEALAALASLLSSTLGNDCVAAILDEEEAGPAGRAAEAWASEAAFEQLQALSERVRGFNAADAPSEAASGAAGGQQAAALPSPPQPAPLEPGRAPRLRADRTAEWVKGAAARIQELLSAVLPPLVTDHRPAVREALARAAIHLLSHCSLALEGSAPLLLETLFALAQDDWPPVAAVARDWLRSELGQRNTAAAAGRQVLLATAESTLLGLIDGFPAALKTGDAAGRAHAHKLTTSIQVSSPQWLAAQLLAHPVHLASLVSTLTACAAFDHEAAGLLLHATPEAGAMAVPTAHSLPMSATDSGAADQVAAEKTLLGAGTAPALLPRMPLGLLYASTRKTFEAVAEVCRTLAAAAAAADAAAGGGTALRSLIDACLQRLRHAIDGADEGAPAADRGRKRRHQQGRPAPLHPVVPEEEPFLQPWQLQAASVIVVLAELLFGASSAWRPRFAPHAGGNGATAAGSSAGVAAVDELESLVAAALPEVVQERVWSLPNSAAAAGRGVEAGGGALPALPPAGGATAQELGCNVVLQRAALECVGTSARALGLRFASSGRAMRAVLLPTLEKLGDPSKLVASSSEAAVGSICAHCGYSTGGLRQLVADNADYIVDGLCRQLRQPEAHPRAPQLFAALLRQSGVAPGLLPLLAEPARQALQGISIIARRKRPEAVFAFLLALKEIVQGAGTVAAEAAAGMQRMATDVHVRSDAQAQAVATARLRQTGGSAERNGRAGVSGSDAEIEEIRSYFEAQRQRRAAKSPHEGPPWDEEAEAVEAARAVSVSSEEWNELQLLKRRAAAAASLAQSAADCAGPLALSSSLPVAVQALRACSQALHALSAATQCSDAFERRVAPVIKAPSDQMAPVEAPAPKLLPSVHLLWAPLVSALQDWRVSVVESAAEALAELVQLAGTFLSRRFAREAWPELQRLLREGPSQRRIIAPGQDDLSSPAAVQRAQRAVLRCLRGMAAAGEGPAEVLAPLGAQALAATAELLGDAQPAAVREAATQTFFALAAVDADAAWALLAAALRTKGATALAAALPGVPRGLELAAKLCAPLPRGAQLTGLARCGAPKLQAMLHEVENLPVKWHCAVLARASDAAE